LKFSGACQEVKYGVSFGWALAIDTSCTATTRTGAIIHAIVR